MAVVWGSPSPPTSGTALPPAPHTVCCTVAGASIRPPQTAADAHGGRGAQWSTPGIAGVGSLLVALAGFVFQWAISRPRSFAAPSSKNWSGGLCSLIVALAAASSAHAPPGVRTVLFVVIASMLVGEVSATGTAFTSKSALQTALTAWCSDPTSAAATYGPIGSWGTSAITDMRSLIEGIPCKTTFNEDINTWDTGQVTHMWGMFSVRARDSDFPPSPSAPPRALLISTSTDLFPRAECTRVQPASAVLRHLQRQKHGPHVLLCVEVQPIRVLV